MNISDMNIMDASLMLLDELHNENPTCPIFGTLSKQHVRAPFDDAEVERLSSDDKKKPLAERNKGLKKNGANWKRSLRASIKSIKNYKKIKIGDNVCWMTKVASLQLGTKGEKMLLTRFLAFLKDPTAKTFSCTYDL